MFKFQIDITPHSLQITDNHGVRSSLPHDLVHLISCCDWPQVLNKKRSFNVKNKTEIKVITDAK